MKVAITGATGFIGRHVIDQLVNLGISPIIICRDSSVIDEKFKVHKIIIANIENENEDLFNKLGKPDLLIHLAWGNLPNYSSRSHFENQINSQYSFLKRLIKSGLKELLVTGTCFEYGMQSGQLHEGMLSTPSNPYGFAKDCLRKQLEFLMKDYPFNLTWTRLFYLFGEGQSPKSLYTLLKNAIKNEHSTFEMSAGEQLRDYLTVESASKYIVTLALNNKNNGIVNVCSGNPISIRKLVEGWIDENNWKIKLDLGKYPYPDYEPFAFWGDKQKLISLI